MRISRCLLAALVLGMGVTACSKASDEADSKRAPEAPPPPGPARLPDSWRLEVELDGEAVEPLTAAHINGAAPDFADSERRGWRIETLLPRAANAQLVIADGSAGVSVLYEVPSEGGAAAPSALRPALVLTRRGELSVAALDPDNPFPRYHGKGGQLRRLGDSQPRLVGVKRLRIYHKKPL
jgi:hypothetical protein